VNCDERVSVEEFLVWLWADNSEGLLFLHEGTREDPQLFEVDLAAAELRRDLYILERIIRELAGSNDLQVVVDKPPPPDYHDWRNECGRNDDYDADQDYENYCRSYHYAGGTTMSIPFSEHKGGWRGVETRLRKPASELVKCLCRGGVLPVSLEPALLSRHNFKEDWKAHGDRLQGSYLVTNDPRGRRFAYQLLESKNASTVAVRKLHAPHISQEVKALAKADGQGGWILRVKDAVKLLDLVNPAPLAARAADLSSSIDEMNELLMRSAPAHCSVRPAVVAAEAPEGSGNGLDEEVVIAETVGPSEVEIVAARLSEYLQEFQKLLASVARDVLVEVRSQNGTAAKVPFGKLDGGWEAAEKLRASAEDVVRFLQAGGTVPKALEATLLNRRNLTKNWKNKTRQLRGGYFLTKGRDEYRCEAIYQLLEARDARMVAVRRLSGASVDIGGLATCDCSGSLLVPVIQAIPLLDLINPAPLAAHAAEIADQIDRVRALLGSAQ